MRTMQLLRIVLFLFGAMLVCMPSDADSEPVRIGDSFALSESEQKALEQSALRGDLQAAATLRNFFAFYEDDRALANFWLTVAAVHGDHDSAYGLWGSSRYSDVAERRLGCFWLFRAAEEGHEVSRNQLGVYPNFDACVQTRGPPELDE